MLSIGNKDDAIQLDPRKGHVLRRLYDTASEP